MYASDYSAPVVNAGEFEVTATSGDAIGFDTYQPTTTSPVFTNEQSGTFAVSAANGDADGLIVENGGEVENYGTFTVAAALGEAATAITSGREGFSLINSGKYSSTVAALGSTTTAISLAGVDEPLSPDSIDNSVGDNIGANSN